MRAAVLICIFALFSDEYHQNIKGNDQLKYSNVGVASADADREVKHKDIYLLAVQRFAVYVPGVDADYEVLRKKYSIHVIPGTSDESVINDPDSFNKKAEKYAEAFNVRVLLLLGCNSSRPMDKCKYY